ncbi:hypothetical protein C8F04DRAFT_1322875 [Mycena alexandri]|uniref:Cyclin n=1 Tax=Mycena alexandri TaxID=1745969 RepID=A0AAD6TJ11_9AGAR|nr:hypothetical protein C8F04DRAFT_1322875 [Mycena alexandri]
MAQATLDALPRELAHWTTSASAMPPAYTHTPHHAHGGHTPMTPPHTDAVEPRRLAAAWGPNAIYAGGNAGGHRGQLLTPPDDTPPLSVGHAQEYYAPPPPSAPAPSSSSSSTTASAATSTTAVAADAPDDEPPLAWAAAWLPLGDRRGSAALVAEKTCEMICYLWFAPSTDRESKEKENVGGEAKELSGRTTPSALQLTASPTFVSFTQKLLETTQVSQSVIILALHYIHRLRLRNLATPAQPGSEFRVAVAGLMMGNKFLDDNTYTNATWAAVSLIPLAQINTMEREFLVGCDYSLFVSQKTYEDWGRLLRGLVGARARAAGGQGGRGVNTRATAGAGCTRPHTRTHTRIMAPQQRRTSVSPKRNGAAGGMEGGSDEGMEVDSGAHEYEYERHTREREGREREEREREREREEATGTAGSKRRAAAAFSPGSYHPPPHGGQNPFAAPTTNGYPITTTTQVYAHPHHQQQQQGQSQRPAPTLVIPRFSSAATPQHRAHGHAHAHAGSASASTSNANASANVNGGASASAYAPPSASAASYASSASSSSSGAGAGPPAYPSVTGYPRSAGPHAHAHSPAFLGANGGAGGIGTPLERFGAMSLSGGGGAAGGEGRPRPRPVSYAGPSSSSSNVNANSLSMFGTDAFTPYAERERERERGRSIYASGGGGGTPARSASYVNVSYGGTPTTTPFTRPAQYEYVPPPPSTVVQYPPQYAAQVAAASNANANSHHQQTHGQQHGQQTQTHLPTPTSSSSMHGHGHGHGSPYGVQQAPHSHSTTSLHASPYGRYSRGGTPPPPPPPAAPAASSTATVGGGYAGNQSQSQYAQTHPQTHPQTLTARWDYAGGAGAGHGGIAHQDLYFYALASSPVSSVSSGDSSSDSRSQNGQHARTASYSSNSDSCSSDDDGGLDADEEMADVEGEGMADDWEGGESDEEEDDEDDDDSARSDDGRGAGVQMRGTGGGWDENVGDAREAARRARLRCVGPPPQTAQMVPSMAGGNASRYHHLPHHPAPSSHPQQPAPHQQFLPSSQQNGLGLVPPTHHSAMPPQSYGAPARWGVQSARTSPVRGPSSWTPPQVHAGLPPRLPHSQSHSSHVPHTQQHTDARGAEQWTPPRMQGMQQWTPPRMSHTATAGYGGSEWTPPRVALPRFADLERWSSAQVHVQATPAPAPCPPMQQGPPQQRETHPHQPRRAVFANAGPPGVSGYAYAY